MLLLADNLGEGAPNKDYCQKFTLTPAPEGANVKGFNILTQSGEYLYRDSWNLYVSTAADAKPKTKNFIFNIEFDGDYVHIKNEGTGKYFGNDDNWEWAALYSDKAGKGNDKSYFRMIGGDESDVELAIADEVNVPSGVYNLQGIRVADSAAELREAGAHGIFVVTDGAGARKVAL